LASKKLSLLLLFGLRRFNNRLGFELVVDKLASDDGDRTLGLWFSGFLFGFIWDIGIALD